MISVGLLALGSPPTVDVEHLRKVIQNIPKASGYFMILPVLSRTYTVPVQSSKLPTWALL
jgi:CTP:molybdopterin cytidylyltransferase MocA